MQAIFLGTGAAEGNPAAYCRCASCRAVRKKGGRDLRTRSSMRLGDHHQIDVSPDTYAQMIKHGIDMFDIEHVLVTHTHDDHFSLAALTDKIMAEETNGKPLVVYLSRPGRDLVLNVIEAAGLVESMRTYEGFFEIVALDYFAEYAAGALAFQTVRGNHRAHGVEEYSINYLITLPDGKRLLYALDTGYYTDETWEYLSGKRTDTLVMDSTFGGRADRGEFPSGHLDVASFVKMLEKMSSIGFIDSQTEIYATHFNPHQGLDHVGLQGAFNQGEHRVTVTYDGLLINV